MGPGERKALAAKAAAVRRRELLEVRRADAGKRKPGEKEPTKEISGTSGEIKG